MSTEFNCVYIVHRLNNSFNILQRIINCVYIECRLNNCVYIWHRLNNFVSQKSTLCYPPLYIAISSEPASGYNRLNAGACQRVWDNSISRQAPSTFYTRPVDKKNHATHGLLLLHTKTIPSPSQFKNVPCVLYICTVLEISLQPDRQQQYSYSCSSRALQ